MRKQNRRLGKQRVCPNHLTTYTIKSKLWRFKKIWGIISKLQQERQQNWQKSQPNNAEKWEERDQYNESMKFLTKAVKTIYKKKEITQKELSKRIRCKVGELKDIWDILESDFKIKIEERAGYRNKQTFYRWIR